MHSALDNDAQQWSHLLTRTLHQALDYLHTIGDRPPATDFIVKEPLALPDMGMGAEATLNVFMQRYGQEMPASNGPRFWGFVTGGTTPAAVMGDWLTSVYDLNLISAANSPAPNLELEAMHWLRDLFGLPAEFQGIFVTGATMANVVGLAIAREWVARQRHYSIAEHGLYGMAPMRVFSGAPHSSIDKALAMLGMGRNGLRSVALLPENREAVDVTALEQALAAMEGQPCIVVANAGTVNTVDFDDLRAIAALKTRYNFWLHVDAAFGGFAACSPTYAPLVEGMAAADSLTIDGHKWLNVPYDTAMAFTQHRDLQLAVFQNQAAYLEDLGGVPDFVHLTPENSRRLRALPVWFSLMAYGKMGYRAIVEGDCALARQWGDRIQTSSAFRLLAPVRLNGVCFTLAGEAESGARAERIAAFLARLRDDGRVFLTPTTYRGVPAIRAAFSNWRTQAGDLAIAWDAMNEVAVQV